MIVIAGHGTVLSKVVWLLANIFRLFFVCLFKVRVLFGVHEYEYY